MKYYLTIPILALAFYANAQEQERQLKSATAIAINKKQKLNGKASIRTAGPLPFDRITPGQNKISPTDTIPWNKLQPKQLTPVN